MPSDWKPFNAVGPGVFEIRIHAKVEYRAMVVTKFLDAIYVLHAFEKKSGKTARRDVATARRRYNDLLGSEV